MKRPVLYLVILIPATSVLMGILMLYVAFSSPDPEIRVQNSPLNKTSWQQDEQPDDH
jgi:hypothetical protein